MSMLNALKLYWVNRGMLELGRRTLREALRHAPADSLQVPRCRALFDAGQIGCLMGDYAGARAELEESLAIARALGEPKRVAAVLQPLGWAAQGEGAFADARRFLEEAVTSAREEGDRRNLAAALNALAQLERVEGKLDAAEGSYRQVLQLAMELEDHEAQAVALLNLAMTYIARGDDGGAEALAEAQSLVEKLGSRRLLGSVLEVSAGLAAARGEWERAALLYGAAEAHALETRVQRDQADARFLDVLVDRARAALGPNRFSECEARGRALSQAEAVEHARAARQREDATCR